MDRSASEEIDRLIGSLNDWRGERLDHIRTLIHEAIPHIEETWKWRGSPVWEDCGIIAVGNAHKNKVKLTFPQGAHLDDPADLFNNGAGKAWRAIDLTESSALNAEAFKALIKCASRFNHAQHASKTRKNS